VNLRKELVTEQQTLNVPVTHEEVYIERRVGSGQVSAAPIGEGEAIRVPVSAEQVNVTKQTDGAFRRCFPRMPGRRDRPWQ